jgi:hypothetical protein
MTPFQGAAALAAKLAALHEAAKRGLEGAAQVVETEAKAEIGHYQSAAGPFAAWPELADSTKADRVRQGFPANEPLLREGEMRDSIEHSPVHMTGAASGHVRVGSNDPKALFQELGTATIPARSFLGSAAYRKAHEVRDLIADEIKHALEK